MAASELALGGTLRAQVEPRGGTTFVALSGNLNEASDLIPVTKLAGPLTLDLSKLQRINSIGVRNWIVFVKACETAGLGLTFERCSPAIVSQMSMITHFMGTRSRVKSILVPYLCPACKYEHMEVLELSPGIEVQAAPPCPKCNAAMKLDDLLETYSEAVKSVTG